MLGLAYWYWTTTPTYALSQIVGAVKNKDTETFEKYVDIESVAFRAIDDVLHGPARESGMFGNFDSMIGVGIIGLFKPEIAEIAKTQVLKFIESGTLVTAMAEAQKAAIANSQQANKTAALTGPTDSTNPAATTEPVNEAKTALVMNPPTTPTETAAPEPPPAESTGSDNSMINKYTKKLKLNKQLKAYGLSAKGFRGIDYIKTDGPTALIGFKFHSEKLNRDITIEIKMEDAGGFWRVTELSNLNDLINFYIETKDKVEESSFLIQTPNYRMIIQGDKLLLVS